MSTLIRALLLLVLASPALADDKTRVLLADADPELQRAVKATLAPWHLEVVVDSEAPTDETHAQMRGDAQTARFVVWRENGDLVVYDRERGSREHRVAPEGPLDAASAAAAALTVKTLMRLEPAETAAPATSTRVVVPTADESAPELRLQAGLAMRTTRGDDGELGARTSLATFIKPSSLPLRFGIAGEIGTATQIQKQGFKGTWNDWSVLALASWAISTGRWEIEPYVGAGALRSMLDGEEGMTERHEREVLAIVRGGTFVRLRTGRFSFGGSLSLDAIVGTPAYTRSGSGSQFFAVPPFALTVGVIAAADLSR